jgi:hypothetical protein
MSVAAAEFLWIALLIYAASGALVAAGLLLGGMRRVDAKAAAAPLRVRLLFVPGIIALWPLLLRRFTGRRPEEDRS